MPQQWHETITNMRFMNNFPEHPVVNIVCATPILNYMSIKAICVLIIRDKVYLPFNLTRVPFSFK